MMYTVDNTTATGATLPNLLCNTEYTVWVHASGGLNNSRSVPRMVYLKEVCLCCITCHTVTVFVPLYHHSPSHPH